MSKRIFTACLGTETHTWAPLPTDTKAYEDSYLVRGGDHPEAINMFGVPLKMWRERAEVKGWNVAEGLCAFATPSGLTVKRTHETLRDEILDVLRAAMPVDAVLLSLHGAMVADGYDDCEEDLVHRIREIIGPDIPIGCELDLHCHISKQFCDDVTAFVIYKEYPHIDFAERAEEVWDIIEATLEGQIKPKISMFDCRMIGLYHTTREPMQGFVQGMRDLEGKDGVLSVSLGHGFPWANIPHVGTRVAVVTDDRQAVGDALAEKLGRELWELRNEITPPFIDLADAIVAAEGVSDGPVVFGDIADNPGGGGSNDGVEILRELITQGVTRAALATIYDPKVVEEAIEVGVGNMLTTSLGAKTDDFHGQAMDVTGCVRSIWDGHFTYKGPMSRGASASLGTCAVLDIGGILVIVSSKRIQSRDPEMFRAAGVDPMDQKILVVKSAVHFRAGFNPIAADIIIADAPGLTALNLSQFDFKRIQRPLYPIDL